MFIIHSISPQKILASWSLESWLQWIWQKIILILISSNNRCGETIMGEFSLCKLITWVLASIKQADHFSASSSSGLDAFQTNTVRCPFKIYKLRNVQIYWSVSLSSTFTFVSHNNDGEAIIFLTNLTKLTKEFWILRKHVFWIAFFFR